jgi:hypothetical protein
MRNFIDEGGNDGGIDDWRAENLYRVRNIGKFIARHLFGTFIIALLLSIVANYAFVYGLNYGYDMGYDAVVQKLRDGSIVGV